MERTTKISVGHLEVKANSSTPVHMKIIYQHQCQGKRFFNFVLSTKFIWGI